MDKRLILIMAADNVATALMEISAGEFLDGFAALQDIPYGHKVSIRKIGKGDHVVKYGEVIGRATRDIYAGEHVHVHNMEGTRGRGDLPEAEARKE
jgi:altronate dehydratase small subunit